MPEFNIVWDSVGTRFLEAGLDRGVLYLPDRPGVPWNGLVSLQDNTEHSTEQVYFNGTKYLDIPRTGEWLGTLNAITYPDEFLECEGFIDMGRGFLIDDQAPSQFSLSYRTLIADDISGLDAGYKVHVLYNLLATPSAKQYTTASEQANPMVFSWDISAVPEDIDGFKPTSHAIFESTSINRFLLRDLESLLYGSTNVPTDGGNPDLSEPPVVDGGDPESFFIGSDVLDGGTPADPIFYPHLPPLNDLIEIARSWSLITVVNHGDGTWSATGPDDIVRLIDATTFQIDEINGVYLDSVTYEITNT